MARTNPKTQRYTTGSAGRYGRTPAQDRKIKDIAKRTANLKNEQLRIVNKDGEVVLENKGGRNAVKSTVGQKRDAYWNNEDAISIHNHPEGGTFSADDLSEFGYGAKEIVASTPEGVYRLIRKSKQTPDWVKLREKIEAIPETSSVKLRQQARENLKDSKPAKEIENIVKRYTEIRRSQGAEKANEYSQETKGQYDKAMAEYSKLIEKEARRLETKPYDDVYREYAKQYGFVYRFEPWKKKK